MKASLLFLLTVLPFCFAWALENLAMTEIKGADVTTGREVEVAISKPRGLVVVFLSAVCPCSKSHLRELSDLQKEYPDFRFVGIHSNLEESEELTSTFFSSAKLPFDVIQDKKMALANKFGAFKTPHAFVLDRTGKVLYQGGVSDSNSFDRAKRKFLREALEDLAHSRQVKTPYARTLGCAIGREGDDD